MTTQAQELAAENSLHCFVNRTTRRHATIFPFEAWAFEAEKRIVQDSKNEKIPAGEKINYYSHPLDEKGIRIFIKYLAREAARDLHRLFSVGNKSEKNKKEYADTLLHALRVVRIVAVEASQSQVWISGSDAEAILDDVLSSFSQPKCRVTLEASFK